MNSRFIAAFVALLLVTTPIAAAGPVGSAAAQPELDGMVGLPDSNVQEDLPVGANSSLRASDLEGSVMASSHADTLQVVVTTPDRASGYVNGSRVGGSGGVALVFQDDTNHAGREVAVPADAVRETVGYVPEVVHGVHESGDGWTSQVEARNGMLFFEIPKFSSNTVTFSGTTTISGQAAVDQSSYAYDVGDVDSVSEFDINVTGNTSTESEVTSGTIGDGGSLTVDVHGNADPSDETLTLTGRETTSAFSSSGSGDGSISVDGNQPARNLSVEFEGSTTTSNGDQSWSSRSLSTSLSVDNPGNVDPTGPGGSPSVSVTGGSSSYTQYSSQYSYRTLYGSTDLDGSRQHHSEVSFDQPPEYVESVDVVISDTTLRGSSDPTGTVSVYAHQNGIDSSYGDGTKVAERSVTLDTGTDTFTFDQPYKTGGNSLTLEFVASGFPTDDEYLARAYSDDSASTDMLSTTKSGGSWAEYADVSLNGGGATDVSVTAEGSTSTLGDVSPGSTASTGVGSMTSSTTTIDVSGNGVADISLDKDDRFATEDPSMDLDGDGSAEASHSGILTSGQTATASAPDGSLSSGSNSVTTSTTAGPAPAWTVSGDAVTVSEDPSATVGSTTVSHSGLLNDGETVNKSVSLSTGSNSADVSTAGGSSVGVEASWTERTETTNPKVVVNGYETGGSTVGTLADGETASLSTNTSWITDGQNDVTVRVGDGSLSGDAPPPMVDLEYRHDTAAEQTTEYAANGWVERYNVSRTFPSAQENATLTIPHSSEVYEVRYVQLQVNGGSWTDVPSEDWTLDGTTLNVALDDGDGDGQVDAGDTIAVRTSAYKIRTVEGKVTVVDPTAPGDPTVETEIRVDDRRQGFHVRVDGTRMGERVHYAHGESWDSDQDHVIVDSTGEQELYLPNAEIGDTAQVTTIPLVPHLSSGDVQVRVAKPDEPTIQVAPGDADLGATVDYEFLNVDAGKTYGLRSASRSRYVDKAEAGAESVTLTDDDSEETLVLESDPDGSGGGGGGGGGAGSAPSLWQDTGTQTTLQEVGVVVGWAALVLLLVAATGRSSLSGRVRWIVVATVGIGSGLLSIEVMRPGMVSRALSAGLEEVVPLAGLAAIGVAIYSVYNWWRTRREEAGTPETMVTLDLGDRNR